MHPPRQLDLFPGAQDVWDEALAALERFDLRRARERIASALQRGEERSSFEAMREAVDWLAASGLDPDADLEALAAALWDAPEWAHAQVLSSAAAERATECVARRMVRVARERGDDAVSETVALARAHLILGQFDAARLRLDPHSGHQRFDARLWAARADVWAHEQHEDAGAAYARALALDPEAIEPRWIRGDALRELLAALVQAHGLPLARALLLAEGWVQGTLSIPATDRELVAEVRIRRSRLEAAPPDPLRDARLFASLLFEDRALDDSHPERRERMAELDPVRFARVLERLRRAELGKAR